ncbi:MAG TPA: hypothetical protein VMI54_14255 [Polyangiaceae bacterium]|nr:hypothetical protein [Polyangiaceae bacterium]
MMWVRTVLVALAVVGCGSARDSSAVVLQISDEDAAAVVTAKPADEIDLTLHTIGPGNYVETPSVSSPAVSFLDASYPAAQNPGGPTQLFRFDAVSSGTAVITIPHTTKSSFEVTIAVR